jgi:hypothetical protein
MASRRTVIEVIICRVLERMCAGSDKMSKRTSKTTLARVLLEAMMLTPRSLVSVGHTSVHGHVPESVFYLSYWAGANVSVGISRSRRKPEPRSPEMAGAGLEVRISRAKREAEWEITDAAGEVKASRGAMKIEANNAKPGSINNMQKDECVKVEHETTRKTENRLSQKQQVER